MKASKQLLKDANITPRLRLGQKTKNGVISTGPHKVTIVKDKVEKGTNQLGKEIDIVKYLVEENGEHKFYQVPKLNKDTGEIHYLVQRLADIPEGSEVILEMSKIGAKNYVAVTEVGNTAPAPSEDEIDETFEAEGESPA